MIVKSSVREEAITCLTHDRQNSGHASRAGHAIYSHGSPPRVIACIDKMFSIVYIRMQGGTRWYGLNLRCILHRDVDRRRLPLRWTIDRSRGKRKKYVKILNTHTHTAEEDPRRFTRETKVGPSSLLGHTYDGVYVLHSVFTLKHRAWWYLVTSVKPISPPTSVKVFPANDEMRWPRIPCLRWRKASLNIDEFTNLLRVRCKRISKRLWKIMCKHLYRICR